MKKIFTLFAAALLGLCAYAQIECPSRLYFELAEPEQPADKVVVYVNLVNNSANLNSIHLEANKPDAAQWLNDEVDGMYAGFSGYGHTILAMWDVDDPSLRETQLSQMVDLKGDRKLSVGTIVIIESLKTTACRFFPVLEEGTTEDNTIARFTVDFSACDDYDDLSLWVDAIPSYYGFYYTGGPEGSVALTPDEPIHLQLEKEDGVVRNWFTAVSTINADKVADNRIFDLMGHELSRVPDSGFYIQNGKKYVK